MSPSHTASLLVLFLLPVLSQANTITSKDIDEKHKKTHVSESAKRHFVQFFSTISATKAEGMKNTLLTQGFPAFINIQSQKRKPHYQVQMGPFVSRSTAHQAKLKVIKHYPQFSFLNSAIVKSSL